MRTFLYFMLLTLLTSNISANISLPGPVIGGWADSSNAVTCTWSKTEVGNPLHIVNGLGMNPDTGEHQWIYTNGMGYTHGSNGPSPSGSNPGAWMAFEFDKVYELTRMWSWGYGTDSVWWILSLKTANLEYFDGTAWHNFGEVSFGHPDPALYYGGQVPFAHDTEINFGGIHASKIVLNVTDNWGYSDKTYAGLSEVRFFSIEEPDKAALPNPESGAINILLDKVLTWVSGDSAASHNVYIGTDFNDVNNAGPDTIVGDINRNGIVNFFDLRIFGEQWLQNPAGAQFSADINNDHIVDMLDFSILANNWKMIGVFKGNQIENSYAFDQDFLEQNKKYYWRIDEINGPNSWKGDVWHFTTINYLSPNLQKIASELANYFEIMSTPEPFLIRTGQQFQIHKTNLREKILKDVGLWPLPQRIPLDIHESESLDHPWCTIKKVYYQIWPNVYSAGLLYMPKSFRDLPAPAMLCPHGHWPNGYAYEDVQKRCLTFANMGYVVFSPPQDHYENLLIGISNQTHMIWRNMRALDYLQSLSQADGNRIGVCGASGGGLQTQMLVGLDDRVKAATIVGLTCDFREIIFPHTGHSGCNHFPDIMQDTDWPEISALGLPASVQYLVMDDWTGHFLRDNYPTIQQLYSDNGYPDRVDCQYWHTGHIYDKPKRERTYWWMEKWLRNNNIALSGTEPNDIQTFAPEILLNLSASVPNNGGFSQLSNIYRNAFHYNAPTISTLTQWQNYRAIMVDTLKDLLGDNAKLAGTSEPNELFTSNSEGLVVEYVLYPGEAQIQIPVAILRPENITARLPVIFLFDAIGKELLLAESGTGSARSLAAADAIVVLPDIRFFDSFDLTLYKAEEGFGGNLLVFQPAYLFSNPGEDWTWGWSRNVILWGRPQPGMGASDIQMVLDSLALRADTNMSNVKIIARGSGSLAIAALFAAVMDSRIGKIDLDFNNRCFENNNLPVVPFVLRHGDILQWSSLLADRELTIHNVPQQTGNTQWLQDVFEAVGNSEGLHIE